MIDQLVKVKEILKKYNQEHLLYFYDELSYSQKENLLTQILDTDFEKILTLYKNSFKPINLNMDDVSPISHVEINKFNSDQINHYKSIGEKIIKLNQFAVVTMAGGQGSRLGYKGPKGTYELALESKNQKKSLFEIMCDDIKRTNEKYGRASEAVNKIKKIHMKKSAAIFLKENNFSRFTIRFDVIEVYMINGKCKINHIKQII